MNDLTINGQTDADSIRSRILTVRGVQVMLDRDLAELYGVPTRRLNEQVKRNIRRFPDSFMFQLTKEELEDWRSQIATSNNAGSPGRSQLVTLNGDGWKSQIATSRLEQYVKKGVRNRPYAFTEHGIIMLASVLKSDVAIDVSIRITNAFVAMRKAIASIAPLMSRIVEVERMQLEEKTVRLADQARNEERFKLILDAMQDKKFSPQDVMRCNDWASGFRLAICSVPSKRAEGRTSAASPVAPARRQDGGVTLRLESLSASSMPTVAMSDLIWR